MYKEAFIITTPIAGKDGQTEFDLPFRIYSQSITCDNVCYYSSLPSDLMGKECLVFIHYDEKDEKEVFAYKGFLGNDWEEVQKDPRALVCWSVKKEDALAAITESKTKPGENEVVKYTGKDCKKIIHPYKANDK